jgi:type I restriction enzyme M protein
MVASSASDAGHSEKDIREKLVKTGAVDVMMAIGNNFFYTRSLPCLAPCGFLTVPKNL